MIQISHLKKSYQVGNKKLEVLKGIDLDVQKGNMIAIMGKSGSGKSTLLNILAGLEQADSGNYLFQQESITGKNLNELASFRRKNIGFILQNYALIDSKNVFDNVALPLRYSKQKPDEINRKVTHILSQLHIESLQDHSIDTLSGGEMQRVAIARALIQDPDVILADEPTGSLDEQTEKEILALFTDINKQGKTFIIVTHDQQVADICQQIMIIKDGKLASQKMPMDPAARL